MSELQQTLGFDTAQALQALTQLDAGFARLQNTINTLAASTFQSFNANAGRTVSALLQITTRANSAADALGRLNSIQPQVNVVAAGGAAPIGASASPAAANALNQALAQTTTQAAAAAGAVTNLGNQATGALNPAVRAAGGFALSLETIGRVIGTQIIVRALNAIRNAIEESVQGFIVFNRSISEIGTISKEPLGILTKQVHELSNQFNVPLLDVAKAKYQAISNGFEDAAESTQVLTSALRFSRIGQASAAEATDLLSTALNAYGLAADNAETASSKLFRIIELGRVTGAELDSSLGRVVPIANELGLNLDEVGAAFTSITVGGVKASEAATQIRSSLTALLKPTEEMTQAFRKLGVEDGQQLAQMKGFKGAFDAVISTTDGTASAIEKLFPNVRALSGVLRETGTGAKIFEDHLKAIKATGASLSQQKFQAVIETNSEKVDTDFRKLKNFFTVELGESLVKATSDTLKFLGGVDTTIAAMKSFAPVVAFASSTLAFYAVTVGTITGLHRLYTASVVNATGATKLLSGAITGAFAAVAAIQLGQFIGDSITRAIESTRKAAEQADNQLLETKRGQIEARLALDNNEVEARGRLKLQELANATKIYNAETEAAQEASVRLVENDKATLEKIIGSREHFAQDLKRAASQANSDIVDSQKRVTDLQGQLDDRRFDNLNKRFNESVKSNRERLRAEELASDAAAKLGKANKPQDREAAQQEFQRAEAFARQALSTAQSAKNVSAQAFAEQTIQGILEKRIAAEIAFEKTRAEAAKKLEEAAAKEEARTTKLKQLAKDFLEAASFKDKKGEFLEGAELDKSLKTAQNKLAEFKETAFGKSAKFELGDLFAFDKLEERLNQSFTKSEVKDLFASRTALQKLRDQIQGSLDRNAFVVNLATDPSKLEGKNRKEQLEEIRNQINAGSAAEKEANSVEAQRVIALEEIAAKTKLATESFKEQKGLVESLVTKLQQALVPDVNPNHIKEELKDLQALQAAREEIQRLLQNPNATTGNVNDLAQRLRSLKETAPKAADFDIQRASDEFNALSRIIQLREQIRAAEKAAADAAAETRDRTLGTANAAEAAKSSFNGAADAAAAIAKNMEAAAAAARDAAAAASQIAPAGGAPQTAALGGRMRDDATAFLAAGGRAKGTDNIHAMLSQDETVINARSSARFFSQLQQIQAGTTPTSNRSEQNVTLNIGDINVNGAKSADATAREIANRLRREFRRGTATLR